MEIGGVQVTRECPNSDCDHGAVMVNTKVQTQEWERPTGDERGTDVLTCRTCKGGGEVLTEAGTRLKYFVENYCDVGDPDQ